MGEVPTISIILVAVGILMIVFHRPIGIGFCRLGKLVWRNNPFGFAQETIGCVYDERKAPWVMVICGITSIVQAVILYFLLPMLE